MFTERSSSGKHMICDIKGIKNLNKLNSCEDLIFLLRKICKKHNFGIIKELSHEFIPIGHSILFLLSESHISIHSFPEKKHLSFDLYTCREYDNDNEYNEIYHEIIRFFDASNDSNLQIIDRYF
jgi:S-adenosylmethionine/arginine decarboxylase-like enzyme